MNQELYVQVRKLFVRIKIDSKGDLEDDRTCRLAADAIGISHLEAGLYCMDLWQNNWERFVNSVKSGK